MFCRDLAVELTELASGRKTNQPFGWLILRPSFTTIRLVTIPVNSGRIDSIGEDEAAR